MQNLNKYIKDKKHFVYLIVCGMSTAEKENDLKSYFYCREKYYRFIEELKKEEWATIKSIQILENYYKRNCALHHVVYP